MKMLHLTFLLLFINDVHCWTLILFLRMGKLFGDTLFKLNFLMKRKKGRSKNAEFFYFND